MEIDVTGETTVETAIGWGARELRAKAARAMHFTVHRLSTADGVATLEALEAGCSLVLGTERDHLFWTVGVRPDQATPETATAETSVEPFCSKRAKTAAATGLENR
jgi:hypothetical protein